MSTSDTPTPAPPAYGESSNTSAQVASVSELSIQEHIATLTQRIAVLEETIKVQSTLLQPHLPVYDGYNPPYFREWAYKMRLRLQALKQWSDEMQLNYVIAHISGKAFEAVSIKLPGEGLRPTSFRLAAIVKSPGELLEELERLVSKSYSLK